MIEPGLDSEKLLEKCPMKEKDMSEQEEIWFKDVVKYICALEVEVVTFRRFQYEISEVVSMLNEISTDFISKNEKPRIKNDKKCDIHALIIKGLQKDNKRLLAEWKEMFCQKHYLSLEKRKLEKENMDLQEKIMRLNEGRTE
ncbi:hypothetical protein GF326_08070 [Candidatus Bathyarchaeota archaeon]|nr:hypothetical protein [Candidatus Bathyarchaeota archaeon]